jgi:hypothetical protein
MTTSTEPLFEFAVDAKEADYIQTTVNPNAFVDLKGVFDVCFKKPAPHAPGTFLALLPLTRGQVHFLYFLLNDKVPELTYLRNRVKLKLDMAKEEEASAPAKAAEKAAPIQSTPPESNNALF